MTGALLLLAGLVLGAPDAGVAFAADAALPAADAGAPAGPPPPKGPPPVARMTCAPNPVRIAEPLVCTIEVVHRPDVTLAVNAPAGAEPEKGAPPVEAPGGQLKSTRRFTLRPMALRDVKVEGVQVVWTEATGGQARLPIPPQRVPVKSVLAGETDPKFRTFRAPQVDAEAFFAAHGPLPYHKTHWPALIGTLVALGVALGVGVGVLVKRWLDARKPAPEVWFDPRPAHVIALEALDRLERDELPAKGEVKVYYVRLSEIVRAYLERRYRFPALEMTSDEIRARIDALTLGGDARVGIDDFLAETDLVKFADFDPGDAATDTVMKLARGLVALTRAPDVEPKAETKGETTPEAAS